MCIKGEDTLNSIKYMYNRNRHSMELQTIRKLKKVSLAMIGAVLVVLNHSLLCSLNVEGRSA